MRDVIVVGAGHNALAAAAYLARAGLDVLVTERRPWVGGAAVTEEPWPGYQVSTAWYVVSLMPPRIVKDVQLKRFGYTGRCVEEIKRLSDGRREPGPGRIGSHGRLPPIPVRPVTTYLCGAGTHPGGGVMGVAGHNCAKVVVADFRTKRRRALLGKQAARIRLSSLGAVPAAEPERLLCRESDLAPSPRFGSRSFPVSGMSGGQLPELPKRRGSGAVPVARRR